MSRFRERSRGLFHRLRFRLMVTTLAVVVVPMVAVVAVLGWWTYDNAEQQSLRIQQQTAAVVEAEVRARILEVETQLEVLDEVLAVGALGSDEQQAALRNLLANNRIYQDLTLVGVDGEVAVRASRAGVVSSFNPIAHDEAVATVNETGVSYFGPVVFDETLREPLTTVAVPTRDRRAGNVDSVLVATVRFKPIWDLLGGIGQSGESDVYVVSDGGLVIAHSNPAVVLSGTEIALPASDGRAVGVSGQDVVIATSPLQVGEQQLTVVAEQPTSSALQVADRAVEVILAVTLVGLLVAVTLVVLAVRHIVRPIERLADSANRIAAGGLTHRADVESPGEIGLLAEAVNNLTDQLCEEIALLEQRVSLRTEELEEATAAQARLIERLGQQPSRDLLTGLPNRFSLDGRLEIELQRAERLGTRVALLLIDIHGFQQVNETFGHGVGDELLVAVGRRLNDTVRAVDATCRIGGDQFAVVQPDISFTQEAASFAERLLGAFSGSFEIEQQVVSAEVSIGVSVSDDQTRSPADLMQRADSALRQAKGEGRGTYRLAPPRDADVGHQR